MTLHFLYHATKQFENLYRPRIFYSRPSQLPDATIQLIRNDPHFLLRYSWQQCSLAKGMYLTHGVTTGAA